MLSHCRAKASLPSIHFSLSSAIVRQSSYNKVISFKSKPPPEKAPYNFHSISPVLVVTLALTFQKKPLHVD